MASVQKFTHDAMCSQKCHVNREYKNPSNQDIAPDRTPLNYSFPMKHNGMDAFSYYKQLIGEKYLYGRGTQREKDAITGCGWVVTLPQEIYGDADKEKEFFAAVYDFISNRYGEENIITNAIHYDEAGLPHIHVVFCPVTDLDHDVVQNKTVKTSNAIQLESGRYEYTYRFKLDENGDRIPLKNYAHMSDYFDEKIDSNTVINKAELQHFHTDLQQYLSDNGIDGAVVNGKTGTNFSVKELKDFTQRTGLHLQDVQALQGDRTLLESLTQYEKQNVELKQTFTSTLEQLSAAHAALLAKDNELQIALERIKALETELSQTRSQTIELKSAQKEYIWGNDNSWGSIQKNHEHEEEKLW